VVESHGGFVFKMVGDACCAAFPEAPEALQAALAAQHAILKEPWDDRVRVRVRIALHTGEAEERGGDYFGPPLNRVARILASGHGGQTLISRATRELVGEDLPKGVELRDMGEHRLRDLKERERIFQLLAPDLPSEFPLLKTLEAPSEDDRYRLIKQIGSGGMAEVYLAYDEVLEREVAFKVLDRKHAENKEAVERFRREARSAASLSHDPNIVSIHDRGHTEDGTYYIVMEHMEGGTLEDLIEREGPLSPQRTTEVALQVARALSAAHEKGVIHRDVKPQNILLSKTGEAKVADFGIARAASATTMTQAGSVMGTVYYISPEQALGENATPRSDLYSLGVVLYEMLTGELPYDAETPVGVVMKHVSGLSRSAREANPEVPEDLDAIVARLLARDPEERYPDAAILAEDLGAVAESLPENAEARETGSAMKERTRRGKRGTRSSASGRKIGTSAGSLRSRLTKVPAGRRQRVGVLVAVGLILASVGVAALVYFVRLEPPIDAARPAQTEKVPTPSLIEFSMPLSTGRDAPRSFRPGFTFTVGKGWSVVADNPTYLELVPSGEESAEGISHHSALAFNDVYTIIFPKSQDEIEYVVTDGLVEDFSKINEGLEAPAPDDIITWLQGHPYLETAEPQPVSIGGKPGIRIDAEVKLVGDDYSEVCGGAPCVVLFNSQNDYITLPAGGKARLTVLKDVQGRTVIVSSRAYPASDFDSIVSKAQKVIDTVEWQGS
jgi:serine/threonine protein kinase